MADRNAALQQFLSITGVNDTAAAQSILEAANWDVDTAVSLFFDEGAAKKPQKAAPAPMGASQQSRPPQPAQTQPKPATTKSSGSGGGIKSFADLQREADDEREAYFAGGSEKSGVQIQDPRQKPDSNDLVAKVFENARKMGGQTAEEMVEEKPKFVGSGFRLGDPAGQAPVQSAAPARPQKIVKLITFYKQGFTVNDGPLRRYDDQTNQAFLEDINQGYVPQELEAEAQGQEVHVELADKKMEDFKEPPKPKYHAFGGSGYSLSSSSSAPAAVATPAPKKQVVVDESKPITTIQIKLADGTRLVAKFNHDHTVLDIRSFIELAQKPAGAYDLVGGFPPKALADPSQTIKDAGLLNAAVNQRMR